MNLMNVNNISSTSQSSSNVHTVEDEMDLAELVKTIWSRRLLILIVTFVFAVLSVVIVLMMDNIYKASVTMLPQLQESGGSKFSGIAALAGIDLSSSSTSNEAFYQDVLKSNKVLDKLILKKWFIEGYQKEMFLYDFLEIELSKDHFDPKAKLDFDLKKYLRKDAISFTSSKINGLMTLSVSMPRDPALSANIANWLANELHEFNESYRQKKALENVSTVKRQLIEAKSELTKSENKLSDFQRTNKNFTQSTVLQLENARLSREVFTENTVYTELRKQFEVSKIDLAKSKETIIILDQAIVPVLKASPRRGLICVVITMLGGIASIIYTLIHAKLKE